MTLSYETFPPNSLPHILCKRIVKGFTTKLFLRIFDNLVVYETFPIQNFLCIRYIYNTSVVIVMYYHQ